MTVLICPAKINLFLAIRGKDASGYHEIETVLARTHQITDELYIEPAEELSFKCAEFPGEENLVIKALRLLEAETGRRFLYKIELKKNIPAQSGLGGASSNAAAIMLYLNEHEGLKIPLAKLMELASTIGMDVPFFVSGFPVAHATHYGERIAEFPALPADLNCKILPGPKVSTKEAYAEWDKRGQSSNADCLPMLEAIKQQDTIAILKNLHNDFGINASYGQILAGSGGALVVFYDSDMRKTEIQTQ
jgi:4-diphosphocytidyl-2-C-methyl-D-erythritol kinase